MFVDYFHEREKLEQKELCRFCHGLAAYTPKIECFVTKSHRSQSVKYSIMEMVSSSFVIRQRYPNAAYGCLM